MRGGPRKYLIDEEAKPMAIPDYQTIMLPLLKFAGDKQEHSLREAINYLASEFNLNEEEMNELLPSETQKVFDNRVGWARTYMKKAGLLIDPQRGYFKIAERGLNLLKENLDKIDIKLLGQFPDFVEFRKLKKTTTKEKVSKGQIEGETPDELIEKGHKLIKASLALELLTKLRDSDPYYFEKIIGNLLAAMGYGKFKGTPKSGDKGIDGIVYQDKLGIDRIYFQAKRYKENNNVPARDIRDFVGTLDIHGVNKGIFITTSNFPRDTKSVLEKTPKHIVLIEGKKLANLMIEYDVGVTTEKTYKIKKIDLDFFTDE